MAVTGMQRVRIIAGRTNQPLCFALNLTNAREKMLQLQQFLRHGPQMSCAVVATHSATAKCVGRADSAALILTSEHAQWLREKMRQS